MKPLAANRSTVRSRAMAKRSHPVEVVRVTSGLAAPLTRDVVAVEEPLEIRVAGETFAVTMRTPGDDRELALGLLFSEGLIASIDDLSAIAHCARADDLAQGNVFSADIDAKNNCQAKKSCGSCGPDGGNPCLPDLLITKDGCHVFHIGGTADKAQQRDIIVGLAQHGIAAIDLPMAEAAIDVDKPADLELVERILAARRESPA